MGNYFSSNLKFIREEKGLSQNKLAQKIGVNQTTIARWEDDNRTPTIDNAVDVSEALNVPLPDLLGKDLRIKNNDKTTKFVTKNGVNITVGHIDDLSAEDILEIQSQLTKHINKKD